ncbi:adenosylcobinamide-phosphate synthase CbiB [Sphingomonas sp. GC_Shp_3]|uniref:adenosylcobinamide-phosphate synthase CbiB n=1 Tax=Sphingomonas sp. GC_Shp_3 TaxID=2937383 RepID=UPI00226A7FD4|nr:adenosylcobinamide-phosphate synthase CbiB [Sphingomonas sp. GC_Shp_3]
MAEPVALVALAIEAAFGWPDALYRRVGHPVGAFARIIASCEARWNGSHHTFARRRLAGVGLVVGLSLVAGGGAAGSTAIVSAAMGQWAWLGCALLAVPGLAQRSLFDHVRAVQIALASGDLAAARIAVARIVGRDVARLDATGVARAAIESLAESFCDGIVAPLFWLLLFGLPGLWIYKAVNTADSLIGHREPRWRAFGWAAARSDDVLNLIPARLAGPLLCLCGGGGWRVLWRDARRHASPNAGWSEAAMAGALHLRLAGPIVYDGICTDKPWIGDGRTSADAEDITRALRLYVRACLALWLIAGGVAWLQ